VVSFLATRAIVFTADPSIRFDPTARSLRSADEALGDAGLHTNTGTKNRASGEPIPRAALRTRAAPGNGKRRCASSADWLSDPVCIARRAEKIASTRAPNFWPLVCGRCGVNASGSWSQGVPSTRAANAASP
jgi:hypothetical protein